MTGYPGASLKREMATMLSVAWSGLRTPFEARVYATEAVPIDRPSIAELGVLPAIADAAALLGGTLADAAFTPDFHRGAECRSGRCSRPMAWSSRRQPATTSVAAWRSPPST